MRAMAVSWFTNASRRFSGASHHVMVGVETWIGGSIFRRCGAALAATLFFAPGKSFIQTTTIFFYLNMEKSFLFQVITTWHQGRDTSPSHFFGWQTFKNARMKIFTKSDKFMYRKNDLKRESCHG